MCQCQRALKLHSIEMIRGGDGHVASVHDSQRATLFTTYQNSPFRLYVFQEGAFAQERIRLGDSREAWLAIIAAGTTCSRPGRQPIKPRAALC
jgi:hypothetical protein